MGQRGIVGFASHTPVLAAAVTRMDGPVIEIGGGVYSTPLLRSLCDGAARKLVTLESDPEWHAKLREWYPGGDLHLAGSPQDHPMLNIQWSVAFVDGSAEERGPVLEKLHHCTLVVVHDTEDRHLNQYPGMAEALAKYRNRIDVQFPPFKNQTSVLSDSIDVVTFFKNEFPQK